MVHSEISSAGDVELEAIVVRQPMQSALHLMSATRSMLRSFWPCYLMLELNMEDEDRAATWVITLNLKILLVQSSGAYPKPYFYSPRTGSDRQG